MSSIEHIQHSFNPEPQESAIRPPSLDGEYTSVHIVDEDKERISQFRTKFGSVSLHTLQVAVTKEYESRAPRTTWYEAKAAYRTDSDAPDQSEYPLVHYSSALYTTPRIPNTATNRYFLNPVYEGYSAVNVSVKQKPIVKPWDVLKRALPHTLRLEEMADDEIAVTKYIAGKMGLGQGPDANGMVHFDKSGYSRGVQLGLVEIGRAGLQGVMYDRFQGRGPGPHNKVHWQKVGGSIRKEAKEEGRVILNHLRNEPIHAINNLLNIVTHRPSELVSYTGDAGALLTGSVSRTMPFINPYLRGYVSVYEHDPFGRHKDYVVNYDDQEESVAEHMYRSRLAPDFYLLQKPGAHLSGIEKSEVLLDRLGWKAEMEYLDGKSNNTMPPIEIR